MKVLIATGGTGGHIFPAIEAARVLRERGNTVVFAGALGLAEEKIKNLDFHFHRVTAKGLNSRSLPAFMQFAWVMLNALPRSFQIVRQEMPDRVIGFGGYGSFALVAAGCLMRYPTMIHEQNVVPGRANAILAKIVKKVAVSFQESRKYFKTAQVVWTGCPCHQRAHCARSEALAAFGLQEGKKTIVLLGGSQGSQKLNEVFFDVMKDLSSTGSIQAIHMTGKKDYPLYNTRYQGVHWPVSVHEFIGSIERAYAAADVVIARAGAATVSELGVWGVAAILVPYPFAGHHQKFNADVLGKAGAAFVLEQKDLTKDSLKEALLRMLASDVSKSAIRQKTRGLFQADAALQLALAVEGL